MKQFQNIHLVRSYQCFSVPVGNRCDIFCDKCTHGRIAFTAEENAQPVEVTHRLNIAKETTSQRLEPPPPPPPMRKPEKDLNFCMAGLGEGTIIDQGETPDSYPVLGFFTWSWNITNLQLITKGS